MWWKYARSVYLEVLLISISIQGPWLQARTDWHLRRAHVIYIIIHHHSPHASSTSYHINIHPSFSDCTKTLCDPHISNYHLLQLAVGFSSLQTPLHSTQQKPGPKSEQRPCSGEGSPLKWQLSESQGRYNKIYTRKYIPIGQKWCIFRNRGKGKIRRKTIFNLQVMCPCALERVDALTSGDAVLRSEGKCDQ